MGSSTADSSALLNNELACWLALLHVPGVGPQTYQRLLTHFSKPSHALRANQYDLKAAGIHKQALLNDLKQPDWEAVELGLDWLDQDNNHLLTLHDANYPALLRETPDPPPLLFVKGDVTLLSSLQIAIVGSRNPTPSGQETSYAFAHKLAEAGLTITSGLALGVDAAAHHGALSGGKTIAVTGTGLDRVYPASHRDLARQIAESGALVSEFPPGTPPLPRNFPRRNRIISGMSVGTLVTEAALRSGSLITARCALEQGREVFAIPGSIHNPLAKGCHSLLRQGAKLTQETNDILEEIQPLAIASIEMTQTASEALPLDSDQQKMLHMVGFDPTPLDILVERAEMTAEKVSSLLVSLELLRLISPVPGGRYIRIK